VLIVDDLLAAPIKGIIWIFEEIHKSATAEQRARRDEIMAALSDLYRALEQGEITDDAFDTREQALLDELDAWMPGRIRAISTPMRRRTISARRTRTTRLRPGVQPRSLPMRFGRSGRRIRSHRAESLRRRASGPA
jgi:hypothetical protein